MKDYYKASSLDMTAYDFIEVFALELKKTNSLIKIKIIAIFVWLLD